ncbi:MAG: GNAT family N-acetyltransferase [Bacteroidota bacterium]
MNIRTATTRDLRSLALLFDAYRVFYRKETDVEAAEIFVAARLQAKDSKIYVAENAEGDLVAFVQLYPLFSSTLMQRLWLLNDLYVAPDFRGAGIAAQLIERAKQLVRETAACGMYLETEKSNEIGNYLYPKTGFKLNKNANFYEWDMD